MNENEIWKRKQRSEEYKNVRVAQLAEAQRSEIRRNAKLGRDKTSLAEESVIKQEEKKLISEAKTSYEILVIQLRKIFERYEIKIENALDEDDEYDIIQKRDEICEKAIERFPLSQIKNQTDADDFAIKLFDLIFNHYINDLYFNYNYNDLEMNFEEQKTGEIKNLNYEEDESEVVNFAEGNFALIVFSVFRFTFE